MALYGGLAKEKFFAEFNDPLPTGEGVLAPAEQKRRALANLGIQNGSDDVSGLGTLSAGPTAEVYGSPDSFTLVLTLEDFEVMTTIGDSASLANGAQIFQWGDGAWFIESTTLSGTVDADASVTSDTPEVGIGSVEAAGATATLSTTTENYTPNAAVAASVADGAVSGGWAANLFIAASGGVAKTVFLNAADGWADRDAGTVPLTFTGTITIKGRKAS